MESNNNTEFKPFTVTLCIDCDPWTGMGRQGNHFEYICKEILKIDYYEPISKFFGCWTWNVTYTTLDQRNKIKEFLTKLYNDGLIRYAEW